MGVPPLLPGGLWPRRLKTAPSLSSTVRSSRVQREPPDSSELPSLFITSLCNAKPLRSVVQPGSAEGVAALAAG